MNDERRLLALYRIETMGLAAAKTENCVTFISVHHFVCQHYLLSNLQARWSISAASFQDTDCQGLDWDRYDTNRIHTMIEKKCFEVAFHLQ